MRKTIKHNISFDINIKPRVDTHIPEREQCSQIDDRERKKRGKLRGIMAEKIRILMESNKRK